MQSIPPDAQVEVPSSPMDHDTPFADMAAGAALFAVAIGVLVLVYAIMRQRRQRQLIAMFLERGQVVPAPLLPRSASRHGEMRRGAWLTALAVGIGLTSWILTRELRYAAWGVIPLCLGVASFINAALFHPRNDPHQ